MQNKWRAAALAVLILGGSIATSVQVHAIPLVYDGKTHEYNLPKITL